MCVYIYHSISTIFAASCKINLGVLNITNKSITNRLRLTAKIGFVKSNN